MTAPGPNQMEDKDSEEESDCDVIFEASASGGPGGGDPGEESSSSDTDSSEKSSELKCGDKNSPRLQKLQFMYIQMEYCDKQVCPLNHFFLFPFCKKSLICLEGKSMTP